MAIGAAAVGGVDGIDVAVEHPRALVYIVRIRGIRRRKFGGYCKSAGAQHALESSR